MPEDHVFGILRINRRNTFFSKLFIRGLDCILNKVFLKRFWSKKSRSTRKLNKMKKVERKSFHANLSGINSIEKNCFYDLSVVANTWSLGINIKLYIHSICIVYLKKVFKKKFQIFS